MDDADAEARVLRRLEGELRAREDALSAREALVSTDLTALRLLREQVEERIQVQLDEADHLAALAEDWRRHDEEATQVAARRGAALDAREAAIASREAAQGLLQDELERAYRQIHEHESALAKLRAWIAEQSVRPV